MTFEKSECSRCTRKCFVIVLGTIKYCTACWDTMCNNPETKELMNLVCKQYGITDKTWHD